MTMKISKKILLVLALALSLAAEAFAAGPSGNLRIQGDELEYDLSTGNGNAKGHVVLSYDGGTATCDSAQFNSNTREGVLKGNVVADRDNMHIVCDEFVTYNENDMSALGNVVITREGRTLSSDRVNYYKLREFAETEGGWARLTDTDGSTIDAQKIDYDMGKGEANAYGGVKIVSDARELVATSDAAVYRTDNSGYVELTGNAKAVQKGNSVAGDKLRLTNTNVASAEGNVKIYYVPEEKKQASPDAVGEGATDNTVA